MNIMVAFETLLLMSFIVLVGIIIRAVTGFGGTLFITPLFILFFDIKFVLPVVLVVSLIGNFYLYYYVYKKVHKRIAALLIIPALFGIVLGSYYLKILKSEIIVVIFAVFVILYSLKMLFFEKARKTKHKADKLRGSMAGFFGGLIDALLGTGAPPIVMYFNYVGLKKSAFRATMILVFIFFGLSRLIAYSIAGLMSVEAATTSFYLIPAIVAGTIIGNRIHFKVNELVFQKVVAVVLLLIGIKLLI